MLKAIIDTNVLVAGLRSKQGFAFRILDAAARKQFVPALSVPLYCEYLDVLSRPGMVPFTPEQIETFCLSLAELSDIHDIYFLWRPLLPDPKDDMVLEIAVAAGVSHIITFNIQDFSNAKSFGITPIQPAGFFFLL